MARPGPRRYDHLWKEVQVINESALFLVQLGFAIRGIGFLVVTWTTVVLLGGFVSMLHKPDFWRLTLITLIQILWINASFGENLRSASFYRLRQYFQKPNPSSHKRQLADKAPGDHPKLAVVVAEARRVVAQLHNFLLTHCILCIALLYDVGLFITTSLSIYGLVKNDYHGDTDEGRTNMYLAHNVLYVLCVAQGALLLYSFVLGLSDGSVKQVRQAYGFQDGDHAVSDYFYDTRRGCEKNPSFAEERNLVTYAIELMESNSPSRCLSGTLILDRLLTRKYSGQIKPPTLIEQVEEKQREQQQQSDLGDKTVAQLMEKEKGMKEKWMIKLEERMKKKEEREKKKHQQREEAIIAQQRTEIKRLIGSASSSHILQKLIQTLDSGRSYDKKMREGAARIVEHVAGDICLEQFPRGIRCISSLIDNFEEYCRVQPYESASSPSNTNEATMMTLPPSSNTNENNGEDQEQGSKINNSCSSSSESESEPDSELGWGYSDSSPESASMALHGYKDLVLIGLSILRSLSGSEENCIIISNTKHLVSKIMAPVNYDLVHRTHHSAWSTSVVEASMRVMLQLMATAKDTKGDTEAYLCQQILNSGAITTMEKIVRCEECKGGELQMTAMQMLMQLRRGSFTKMLVDFFIKDDRSDVSVRKTAGKELVLLFLSSKSVVALPSKEENNDFVGGLADIVSQDGNDADCRKSAAEILEHMCIHYANDDEYLKTLKNAMAGAMPKVFKEILLGLGLTGEGGKPGYLRLGIDIESQVAAHGRTNNKKNSNSTSSSPWQNQHHKFYVALLSLYVTACEKLHLDIDVISPGEGDQGEGVAFRFAMQMVQSNRDRITADSLKVIKLSTRMVIATLMKLRGTDCRAIRSADLESLMDLLTSISETMLDLEGSMVFTAETMTAVPATADTLDSLVKRAQELHS